MRVRRGACTIHAVDAAWSARRGDWSLVAFLAFGVAVFAAVAFGASLHF